MTTEVALRLGATAGSYFHRNNHEHRILIAKDTCLSGHMIETAWTAGFLSTGMNVFLLAPVPTSAVAYLQHSLGADVGVMIWAGHNPASDNGIKLFDPNQFKLSDETETSIFALLETGVLPTPSSKCGTPAEVVPTGMTKDRYSGAFNGHRFPPEFIAYAVWSYSRFPLSLRDVEDLLAARTIILSYEAIRKGVEKFGTKYAASIRRDRPAPSNK